MVYNQQCMIDIKKCNYITGTNVHAVSFGLSKIIDFLETAGRNPILMSHPKNSSDNQTTLKYIMKTNSLDFKNWDEFRDLLKEKENLFRVDLIVADLWKFNLQSILEYKKLLDETGIDYIIVSDKYHYVEGDQNTMVYKLDKIDSGKRYEYDYSVTEMINGWSSSLDNLVKTYRRDKKIGDIFGESED